MLENIFDTENKRVKINKYIYDQLLKEAKSVEGIESLINDKLFKCLEYEEEKKKQIEIKKENDKNLEKSFQIINDYLKNTTKIQIGITNALVGHENEHCIYILKRHESLKFNSLTLELERNGEITPIKFDQITEIKFKNIDEHIINVWIYMKNHTWRFFLHIGDKKDCYICHN